MSLALPTIRPAAASPETGGLVPMLAAAFHGFVHWRRSRRAIRQLSNYSDAMLKDIGLTRGEIAGVVREGRSESLTHHRH